MKYISVVFFILNYVTVLCSKTKEVEVSSDGSAVLEDKIFTEVAHAMKPTLVECRKRLFKIINETYTNGLFLRLAWQDAETFRHNSTHDFPKRGGANGSIRFILESEDLNKSYKWLKDAMDLLKPLKKRFKKMSYADLIHMAAALSIEQAGGPAIEMVYGRIDAPEPTDIPTETPSVEEIQHLQTPEGFRDKLAKMGLSNREMVALSGAYFSKDPTSSLVGKTGLPKVVFNNGYYVKMFDDSDSSEAIVKLRKDAVLFLDDRMTQTGRSYAYNQEYYFDDYAAVHKKMSELGAKFVVPGGVPLPPRVKPAESREEADESSW